jgi:cytochrome c-type biogenesis protein CcmH/NrfG
MVERGGRWQEADGRVRRDPGCGGARLPILLFVALLVLLAPTSSMHAQAGRAAMDEGVRLMNANQAAKAEKKFEEAVKADPKVALYHLWLGRAVGDQAQDASIVRQPFMARRVKAEFEKAVELDPTLLDARDGLISFYLQAPAVMGGSLEKAKEQQRLIAAQDAMRGHSAQVNIAWHQRDTVATEAALRAAIATSPDSVFPVIRLAQMQLQWGRTTEAFGTLDGFLATHPADIPIRFQVARLAAISGQQLPRAERMLRELFELPEWPAGGNRPSRAAMHFRLGMVQEKSGRKDEARASYETAIRLDPNLQLAKDALKALK